MSGNAPEAFCHEPQPEQTAEELFEAFLPIVTTSEAETETRKHGPQIVRALPTPPDETGEG
ncbi:hypothetical protein Q31a_27020 [Aureliella helgolandensis]|uniref:Uncharacterized protein n=1 Tax=Aureliella helgolandensis TaxID=2527968 RepID=A0A518G727_9BACT|nr:hypothetical protein Q31a_27020 [Aureliella helgolandensis]